MQTYVERIEDVATFARFISSVPGVYINSNDPDDSHYVDLAIAGQATLVTTRDRHLLNLMNRSLPAGAEFAARFPQVQIVTPEALLALVRLVPG